MFRDYSRKKMVHLERGRLLCLVLGDQDSLNASLREALEDSLGHCTDRQEEKIKKGALKIYKKNDKRLLSRFCQSSFF